MEQSLIHFGVAAACQFVCSTGCVYAAAAGEATTRPATSHGHSPWSLRLLPLPPPARAGRCCTPP